MTARFIDIAYFVLAVITLWYLSNATERIISANLNPPVEVVSFKSTCESVNGIYSEQGNQFHCVVRTK